MQLRFVAGRGHAHWETGALRRVRAFSQLRLNRAVMSRRSVDDAW